MKPLEEYKKGNKILKIYYDDSPESPRSWDNLGTIVSDHSRYNLGDKQQDLESWVIEMFNSEFEDDQHIVDLAKKSTAEHYYVEQEDDLWYVYDSRFREGWKKRSPGYSHEHQARQERWNMIEQEVDKNNIDYFFSFNEMLEHLKTRYIILPVYIYDHSGVSLSTEKFSSPWDSGLLGYVYVHLADIQKEKLSLDQAKSFLKGEIETYSDFLNGNVYGYELYKERKVHKIYDDGTEIETFEEEYIDSCWGFYGDTYLEQIKTHVGW